MLKSYEAIYDHGKIQWLSDPPPDRRFKIVVVVEQPDNLTTEPAPRKRRVPPPELKGSVQWLGDPFESVISEVNEDEAPQPLQNEMNGPRLAKIVGETDSNLLASIAEKFGDPVEWQREQRKELER